MIYKQVLQITKKVILIYLTIFSLSPSIPFGQTQLSLGGLPNSQDIIANIRGSNQKETYAKQIAALNLMFGIVRNHKMHEYHLKDTKQESDFAKDYNLAIGKLKNEYNDKIEPLNTDEKKRNFNSYCSGFENSQLEQELINTLFNDVAKEQYFAAKKINDQKVKDRKVVREQDKENKEQQELEKVASEQNQKNKKYKFYFGIFLMIIPFTVYAFWRGKRKFKRKNKHGVEEFDSYGKLVKTNFIEEFAWIIFAIIMIAGFWLILLGT